MNYLAFATLYDSLMEEAPYDEWKRFVINSVGPHRMKELSLLDVGCGTGELVLKLLDEGVTVTGVDLSADMLVVAKEKCERAGYTPLLIQQNMSKMPRLGEFDVVTVFCDSLNYLTTEDEVKRAFHCFAEQLSKDGLLLFDVHSISKINDGFIGQTFADDRGDIAYIWTSFEGEFPNSVEHELRFFVQNDSGLYDRYDELHKQRTFPVSSYESWLEDAGFVIENISADFTEQPPHDESERIFIKARKKNK
ncbi:class I SAM-dependent DNA methyltransferase [Halalkalibacter urbisdiaboli]|uniref:class I SAM-dependent DNA methyltransferase n=1 Tax=Halalkalibacter urbisdiaboli TaxID=1960589 RepID=UPI000B447E80|nr:class I SAM-dependent methyltransferase [Halalkalibacter urbisdiaboli]